MKQNLKVWHNGNIIDKSKAVVPLLSHGFSRASAIFEVFGVHRGPGGPMAFRMDEHLKRLRHSANILKMTLKYDEQTLRDAVSQTVAANRIQAGMIKIMAYWKEESLIELVLDSSLDVTVFAVPADPALHLGDTTPITACLSKWRKLHPETAPVTAKACANYLNAYLVQRDARERGFDVGLLLSTDGFLTEGALESVFLVRDGILRTPPSGRILSSISRKTILEIAPHAGIPVDMTPMRTEALYSADEIFTSHTGIKVSPVKRFEDRELSAPGPVTQKLMHMMNRLLGFEDDRFAHWFHKLD
ncbi:MAG TPA: hypothetical protein ENN03_07810 [bacterium]|nr:hypothetical protein [bacterium]